jgi:hypothetical protein
MFTDISSIRHGEDAMTAPASMGESVFICGRNPLIGSLKNDIFVSFWGLRKQW